MYATLPVHRGAYPPHEESAPLLAWWRAEQVGTVDFQTSCSPAVKADMNRAVALLHSFWFPEARQEFEAVAAKDPGCAIAHWGVALTYWGNPFGGLRTPQAIAATKAAIAKAAGAGTPTRREQGYIDAVAALAASDDVTTQRARVVAYEQAMAQIAKDNPGDVEARMAAGKFVRGFGDNAPTTINLPYDVAKKMIVENDQNAAMQAFMSGQIQVEGDMGRLMMIQAAGPPSAESIQAAEKIRAMTE